MEKPLPKNRVYLEVMQAIIGPDKFRELLRKLGGRCVCIPKLELSLTKRIQSYLDSGIVDTKLIAARINRTRSYTSQYIWLIKKRRALRT